MSIQTSLEFGHFKGQTKKNSARTNFIHFLHALIHNSFSRQLLISPYNKDARARCVQAVN